MGNGPIPSQPFVGWRHMQSLEESPVRRPHGDAGEDLYRKRQQSPREPLIKSHKGRCGKNGPRARRLGASIPAVGCKRQANTAPGLLSPQPAGLNPFVDFCLAVSRRSRPPDCFAGYDAAPAARRCGVARSGETAAGIAQHSRLQKSANALQRPSWDLISGSLIAQ